jgi:hypothetical protein
MHLFRKVGSCKNVCNENEHQKMQHLLVQKMLLSYFPGGLAAQRRLEAM